MTAAISRDGTRLAFTAKSQRVRAWTFPFDAIRARITGNGQPVTSSGGRAAFPMLSRDGKKLAFAVERTGTWELWQRSLVDGREAPIISDEYERDSPQWSPDGEYLAYQREKPADRQLMIWSTESGKEQPLSTSQATNYQIVFDWSPDGRALLVSQGNDAKPFEVWLVPIAAAPHAEIAARRVIASASSNLYQAHFSPDGRWIAFEAATETPTGMNSSLFVTSATGGEWIRIGRGKHYWDDKPRWSPDGKTIYFISGQSGFFDVWGIHFDPAQGIPVGNPFEVTKFHKPSLMISQRIEDAELSITQARLALLMEETSGSIWALENVDK